MKYRVLKPFISPSQGAYHEVGNEIVTPSEQINYFEVSLVKHGFIEEIKDEPWKPKEGEGYWSLDCRGQTQYDPVFFHDSECEESERIGNCFRTEEEAEKAAEWLKAFKVLREDTKGFRPDWNDPDQVKFSVFCDHTDKTLETIEHCDTQSELIIFATEADAEKSIRTHSKEWLTYFNVEEA